MEKLPILLGCFIFFAFFFIFGAGLLIGALGIKGIFWVLVVLGILSILKLIL